MSDFVSEIEKYSKPKSIGRFILQDNYAVTYRGDSNKKVSDDQLAALQKNWGKVKYKGNLSKETQKKIRTFATIWSRSIETYNRLMSLSNPKDCRRIVFITLTLSSKQNHDDNWIKRNMLATFLQELKRKYNIVNYFWRAESQKNGNIHFHILTDSYIPKSACNYIWDRVQFNNNYIIVEPVYSSNYQSPSTRIESPKSDSSIAIYCVKYCLKEEGYRIIEGRIWGCSERLKTIEPFELNMNEELLQVLLILTKNNHITNQADQFFDLYFGNVYQWLCKYSPTVAYCCDDHHYNVYLVLYHEYSSGEEIDINNF